jgi:hypothetical protein
MNKKDLSVKVGDLWNELNSDISKESKLNILLELEGLVNNHLKPVSPHKSFTASCDMVIEEFRSGLERNQQYVDTLQPSNLGFFLLAIGQSNLPD